MMKELILFSFFIVIIVSCNKDDCQVTEPLVIAVIPKFCEVENPLTDLPWLSEAYDSIKNINTQGYIHIYSYELRNGEELIGITDFRSGTFYTCSGDYFCSFGGWSNDCYPRFSSATVIERVLLYPE